MNVLDNKAIAAHVLRHLASAHARGLLVRLDELACAIGVRREDVRTIVSRLHAEGHLDATRMKLTMTGLVLAASMRGSTLRAVRNVPKATVEARSPDASAPARPVQPAPAARPVRAKVA